MTMTRKERIAQKVAQAKEYLATPFAKEWLEKMKYTTRTDEFGNKFLFLAILCGYEQMCDAALQELCDAICWVEFEDELRMDMWFDKDIDWTMFFFRPGRVDGNETYYCGVVAEDNVSPENWDENHDSYSFDEYGMRLKTKKYIDTLPSMTTEQLQAELGKKENGEWVNYYAYRALNRELENRKEN